MWRCRPRLLQAQAGAAALEFALVLPLLLVLLMGTAALGHGLVMRFMLSSAAYDAARACTLGRQADGGCVKGVVEKQLGDFMARCPSPNVSTSIVQAQGLPEVQVFEVEVECKYKSLVGTAQILDGLDLTTITAKAAMPY